MCDTNNIDNDHDLQWERFKNKTMMTYAQWTKQWTLQRLAFYGGQSSIHYTKCNKNGKINHYTKVYKYKTEQQLMCIFQEYVMVRRLKLLCYRNIAYGKNNNQCYITMIPLKYSLEQVMNIKNNDIHNFHSVQSVESIESNLDLTKSLKYFIIEIAANLYHLHCHHYVHLDIKPSNCCWRNGMLEKHVIFGNGWKLIDYGITKYIHPNKSKKCIKLNSYYGTTGWSAPEMSPFVTKENPNIVSCKADIWSFGLLILYIVNKGDNIFDVTKQDEMKYDLTGKGKQREYFYNHKLFGNNKKGEGDQFIADYLTNLWLIGNKIEYGLRDLLWRMLRYNQNERISAIQILQHQYLKEYIKFDAETNTYFVKRNNSRKVSVGRDNKPWIPLITTTKSKNDNKCN